MVVVVLGNGERATARVPPAHKSDRFWFRQALVSEKQQEMNVGHLTLEQASIIDRHYCDGWENWWVKSDWKQDENMAGKWNY
ncbi:hypothetical protein HanIR_Chr13g0634681 [Helianthus annuus]|nr:hypothetical protein HanIR_Chr13g0634681 [Helianthus annuus]